MVIYVAVGPTNIVTNMFQYDDISQSMIHVAVGPTNLNTNH